MMSINDIGKAVKEGLLGFFERVADHYYYNARISVKRYLRNLKHKRNRKRIKKYLNKFHKWNTKAWDAVLNYNMNGGNYCEELFPY